jgi:hypothetical protein
MENLIDKIERRVMEKRRLNEVSEKRVIWKLFRYRGGIATVAGNWRSGKILTRIFQKLCLKDTGFFYIIIRQGVSPPMLKWSYRLEA